MSKGMCTWEGCDREATARSYCGRCYQRAKNQGLLGEVQRHVPQPSTCTVEGCDKPSRTRGLCQPHYMRQYRHGDPAIQKKVRRGPGCSVEGCRRQHQAQGYCVRHYNTWKRHGDPLADVPERQRNLGKVCAGPECDRPAISNGLCNTHEMQQRTGGVLSPIREYKPKGGPCGVDGCDGTAQVEGYCQTHQRRKLRGDPNWDRLIIRRRAHGEGHINEDGYRVITVNGRPKLEHRHIMEQLLGRRLLRAETVHHVRGSRSDNRTDGPLRVVNGKLRSGNLELWSTAQPAGQEVPAKVAWARELLALYGDLVPER